MVQVKPQEGEGVVTKVEINSFKGTDLEAQFKAAGVRNTHLSKGEGRGTTTDRCEGGRWTTWSCAAR
jgi:nicotinamidase-related amidase